MAGHGGLPAALINFAEVIHLDLAPRGVDVFLIKPGFVATPLAAHNDFRMPALQMPAQAMLGWEFHFGSSTSRCAGGTTWVKLRSHVG